MKILVIDANSIVNRAFYGIKLLTTKDGRYTNAIYGFLNIFLKLREETGADCVAFAFDLKSPTFRHKLYSEYKAGRKGMPDELAEQMPILKELLTALGYKLVALEGYEADDILGTLSAACREEDECFIATGDRDSLQLVGARTRVLLASTKMGRPETRLYDEARVLAEYSVTPPQLIDVKALMGDSSDNILGVAGVGRKTAETLISEFGSIRNIYGNLDMLPIKDSLREKLRAGRDSAFMSYELGKICTSVPMETDYTAYVPGAGDPNEGIRILRSLEMFKLMEKLGLDAAAAGFPSAAGDKPAELPILDNFKDYAEKLKNADFLYEMKDGRFESLCFASESFISRVNVGDEREMELFCAILEDASIEKRTWNIKPVCAFAFERGFSVRNVTMDLMLAAYLLNPSARTYDIQRLANEYTVPLPPDAPLPGLAAAFLPLSRRLAAALEQRGQTGLLREIEIPLAGVLASMEKVGVQVDKEGIERFGRGLSDKIDGLQKQIYELAGEEFNVNSPKQLGAVLFEKLKLPAKRKTKSGYSTNADVLESLEGEHEIVRRILEYRTCAKLKSTYCDGLLKQVSADGRIHSSFNQTETRTGRISSTEPNLQNIPVRTELGRELRRFFTAGEGKTLVDADYSQIELRVLADVADDRAMQEAFNRGEDIHAITASQVFHMPLAMVTPLMRSRAKAVNFGIVYGIGAFSLGREIGVSRAEADRYIRDYLHHYEGVNAYMTRVVEQAKRDGYVTTLFKRRRYLPELSSSNAVLRAFGERVARNMPIQGAAADIIKIAMIRVHRRLRDENLAARLILQIHDELIVEAPLKEAERVREILTGEMENACKMKVRLKSDAHVGRTWYDAKG